MCYFTIVKLKRKENEKRLIKRPVSTHTAQQFLSVHLQFDGSDRVSIV
jgi:hypothetical protein